MKPEGSNISLSEWYACLDAGKFLDPHTSIVRTPKIYRCGPLTVYSPGKGCQIVNFGKDGISAALFDGYLFDKERLATTLKAHSERPTEAQLAALAYERWGPDIFDHLEGGYLIAIWDGLNRRFLVGRDAVGKHPLYYAQRSRDLWFSSNVLALAHSGMVPKTVNRKALALALANRWPPAGETFFAEIRRVRPGHYLALKHTGRPQEISFWQPMPEDDEPWLTKEAAQEAFEPLFRQAVARRMELGAQGIMLSGGVDSVSVAVMAADYTASHGLPPLTACSAKIPPGDPPSYEDRAQDLTVERLDMPHVTGTPLDWLDGRDIISASLDYVPHLPGPTDIWWTGNYLGFYRHVAGLGINTLLTGSGGDEWLRVDWSYAADLLRLLAFRKLFRLVEAERRTSGDDVRNILYSMIWRHAVGLHLRSVWGLLAPNHKHRYYRQKTKEGLVAWLYPDQDLAAQVVDELEANRMPDLTQDHQFPRTYYRHALRCGYQNSRTTYDFEREWHTTGLAGLRLLAPYHDRPLIDMLIRTPPEVLYLSKRAKGLARSLVARRLTDLDIENQKKEEGIGKDSYLLRSLIDNAGNAWRRVGCRRLADLGLVYPERLEQAVNAVDRLPYWQLERIFCVLSAETWLHEHG